MLVDDLSQPIDPSSPEVSFTGGPRIHQLVRANIYPEHNIPALGIKLQLNRLAGEPVGSQIPTGKFCNPSGIAYGVRIPTTNSVKHTHHDLSVCEIRAAHFKRHRPGVVITEICVVQEK